MSGPTGRRLLVLGAGSYGANNLIRALRAGDPTLFIAGCHDDAFALKKSIADRHYLAPSVSRDTFPRALRHIIEKERVELAIPNSDPAVLALSRIAADLPCRTFLPSRGVVEQCQDKYALAVLLRERGICAPATYAVSDLAQVESIFEQCASAPPLWCRARAGEGSLGASPVSTPEQARSWIGYWTELQGIPASAFTLSEYLPGRDFMVQCLFRNGTPLMAKMFERLSYHTLNAVPSGVSSVADISKMTWEPRAVETCIRGVLALDPRASGIFFADMKENAGGEPCITEINAGRFSNMPTIHDATTTNSMSFAYMRMAFDEPFEIPKPWDNADDCYVMRGVDALPVVLKRAELLEGLEDAR